MKKTPAPTPVELLEEIVEPEQLDAFESPTPVRVTTESPARASRALGPRTPYAALFRALENARTAAWRALEAGDAKARAAAARAGVAAFEALAALDATEGA